MLGYSKSAAVVLLHLFLLFGNAYGAPTIPEKRTVHTALRLARDGENIAQSTTVQVTNVLQTSVGAMLQICTIQLDPITGDNGEPLVRETKSCKVTMADSGNNSSGSNGSDGSNSSSSADSGATSTSSGDGSQATSTDTSSASDASSTATDASSTATDASASSTAESSSATDGSASSTTDAASASPTSTSGGAVKDDGVTLVPGSDLPSGATGADTATATATDSAASATATASSGAKAVQGNGFSTIDASAVSSGSPTATASGTSASAAGDAASSATSAADQAATSAAKFELPGTHLSVLPIGLGVFAGISVIALIVVGLVTYERTKYRKAFRQRKLAESGAAMGYGGMAQAA